MQVEACRETDVIQVVTYKLNHNFGGFLSYIVVSLFTNWCTISYWFGNFLLWAKSFKLEIVV